MASSNYTHLGVPIFKTEEGYFAFNDTAGHRHIRNPRVKGGTLTALKQDIGFYRSQGWV